MAQEWTVKFTVADPWVADGFSLNNEIATDMIQSVLLYAASEEVSAEIIESPPPEKIKDLQGW